MVLIGGAVDHVAEVGLAKWQCFPAAGPSPAPDVGEHPGGGGRPADHRAILTAAWGG